MNIVKMKIDDGSVSIVDPSVLVFTIDVSKVPSLCCVEANDMKVRPFMKAVLETLPKTLAFLECNDKGDVVALKFLFSVGEDMEDWVSNSPLYRLEKASDVPFSFNASLMAFYPKNNGVELRVLDKSSWNFICQTLNSDAFRKKAFPDSRGNA